MSAHAVFGLFMAFRQLANQDFERAVWRAFLRKMLNLITRKENALLPFDAVRERLPMRGQHYLGIRQVPIGQIVGSMGRYHDFDRAFLPLQKRTRERWINIDTAHYQQVELPPVELVKLGEIYFVKDGNHRVSVARERGQEFIDAEVTEIDAPVVFTPDMRMDELLAKKEAARFLMDTGLADLRPGALVESRVQGQYDRLKEHISVHRWYLGEQSLAPVSLSEAAASWYDTVYLPLVEKIREQKFLQEFPGASEADLYVWIIEFQAYLKQAYREDYSGGEDPKVAAGRVLLEDFPQAPVKKLVAFLNRTLWIDDLILRQERAEFLEQTRLLELEAGARVELSIPGKYDSLLEHIAVHRWYLGEQKGSDVPYEEAVRSWYERVYLPVVQVIREQEILSDFPQRTETDLYLWLVQHKNRLETAYGEEAPGEQAEAPVRGNGSPGER